MDYASWLRAVDSALRSQGKAFSHAQIDPLLLANAFSASVSPVVWLEDQNGTKDYVDFQTHIMYGPPRAASTWIPCLGIDWHCHCSASNSAGAWAINSNGCINDSTWNDPNHPQWTFHR